MCFMTKRKLPASLYCPSRVQLQLFSCGESEMLCTEAVMGDRCDCAVGSGYNVLCAFATLSLRRAMKSLHST